MFRKVPLLGLVAYAHDIIMVGLCFPLALYIRVGDAFPNYWSEHFLLAGAVFVAICALVFWAMDLYRGIWRYASINDLWSIVQAVTIATLVFLLIIFLWTRVENIPRSFFVINWGLLIGVLGGSRLIYRVAKDRRFQIPPRLPYGKIIPVILVGSGDAAELFIRSLQNRRDTDYVIVGILAENAGEVGRRIHGVEVLGVIETLEAVVDKLGQRGIQPQRVILSENYAEGAKAGALLERCVPLGLSLARLPRLTEFKDAISDGIKVRPVAVEDLLGRPQARLDPLTTSQLIKGRRVLVTGAGGSIGGELSRQISALLPAEIVLLDHSEHALYQIDLALRGSAPRVPRHTVIADVRDQTRINRVFQKYRPELVFHAAALKHVPLVEANPIEGINTNVLGTVNVAEAAREFDADAMVLISTDKAVNPSSVMGASKRLAELWCQALDLDSRESHSTRFVAVRFGNVLGSNGSVVPLFQKQIATGGPLTVTHPDMTRYFMTLREAVELVLHASVLGRISPPDGRIYVLDMGEPVKIVDLARQMIRLAGLKPNEDMEIEFIGSRPGEKLLEEVYNEGHPLLPTKSQSILVCMPPVIPSGDLAPIITKVGSLCSAGDNESLIRLMRDLVPEYREVSITEPEYQEAISVQKETELTPTTSAISP